MHDSSTIPIRKGCTTMCYRVTLDAGCTSIHGTAWMQPWPLIFRDHAWASSCVRPPNVPRVYSLVWTSPSILAPPRARAPPYVATLSCAAALATLSPSKSPSAHARRPAPHISASARAHIRLCMGRMRTRAAKKNMLFCGGSDLDGAP